MKKNDREHRIISLLEMRGEMSVEELSAILGISASTLRKQLAEMRNKGLIIRTYGGVMSVNPVLDESFDSKLHKNVAEKRRIATKGRSLIKEGSTVALASGTSVYALCTLMNDMGRGTVYTNSMQVAEYLARCASLEIHICGGIIRSHTGTIIGNDVADYFKGLKIDCAFLGCDAIDSDGTVYSDNLAAATSERAVITSAKKIYVLCDSSKLGKKSVAKITHLSNCTALITGKEGSNIADALQYITEVIYV